MSRSALLGACLVLQLWVATLAATGTYSVVGPGTIRSNFKYNVAVSVHKCDGPSEIKIGITGPSYNETKTLQVQPMETKSVEFDVPQLKNGDYNLTAEGVSGLVFKNSTKLNYADYKPSVLIQTDKATYKPGDLIQFRVLFLDANARPATVSKPITILINDGARNRLKQFKDVQLTKGVYTGQYQLSEQPVLGNWNLELLVEGTEGSEKKQFEVAKYVLPKFEVTIETAKDVAIPNGVVKATIRAKYTYGKAVKGKAVVSIKPGYHYYGQQPGTLEATKTIEVDGKGHVEFNLQDELRLTRTNTYVPPLQMLAVLEEELTGNKLNATATVTLHVDRYRVEGVDPPYTFKPGKPIVYKVVVKNVDGSPVRDATSPVKLIIEPPGHYFYRGIAMEGMTTTVRPEEVPIEFESSLNENGMATFEFTLPEKALSYYTVKSQFLETKSYLSSLSRFTPTVDTPELLKLVVNTQKPQLGKAVSVEVKSSEPIPYFVYTIVGRGNILLMEHVEVPEGRNSHTIKFMPTFEMIPKATIFVHFIFDNNLRFEEATINFEKDFENSIDISAPVEVKPGEEVKLKITTDPESFVGLLGVDQSVLLLKSGNDLSKDEVFNQLQSFDTNTPWMRGFGRYPGQSSGLVTMTNANFPYNDDFQVIRPLFSVGIPEGAIAFAQARPIGSPGLPGPMGAAAGSSGGGAVEPPQVRKEFPENWIFANTENTEGEGFTLAKKIPDTITSWVITGFSLNPKSGIALTENPSKIRVFQPFFVSTSLPYSVKRGEVFSLPVIIFNYMNKTLDAEVTMDNTDQEYEFTEATNEVSEAPIAEVKRVKRVSVPSNSGRSVSFMIRPKNVGPTTLKITAVTPLAGDTIHQILKVEPEGVTQYENRAVFVNLKDIPELSQKLTIEIPAEAVPDSEHIEFAVMGDLLGPTLNNLDKLVRMPYGCGEQNMVNFVPNILVLRYLEAINREMPTVVEKAKKFMEIGYQRELTYKHDDGSYSAFGKNDKAGSTWLTAYVMRSFHQAAKYIDIDPKIIVQGLDFLAEKQAANGSFPEFGKLFDSAHQNELGLTSFVLLAFLENKEHADKYSSQIVKGMKFLEDNVDRSDDQYALSIAVSALQLGNHPLAEKVLAKLNGLAKQEDGHKWWSKEPQTSTPEGMLSWRPRSNDVEITSYILLALLEKESPESVLPIIKWLISQRNSNGGFASTQDTVVGLQALIKFAEKTGSGNGNIQIDFVSSGGSPNSATIQVNPENSLVLQTHVLPKTTRAVDFIAKGQGSCMVQLSYRYNLAEKERRPSFKVATKVKEDTPPRQLVVEVCAEFVPLADAAATESNMAVMEVALPSGFTADADSFGKIQAVDRVKRTETKNSDSTVIIYFDGLPAGAQRCVPVEATKTHAVAKQKPAAVRVYDYYDTGRSATDYYSIDTSLCDICEAEDCGAGCQPS